MKLNVFQDPTDLSYAVADWMVDCIQRTLATSDHFTLALSGGSTPQKLHRVLSSNLYKDLIDWSKVHIFWGDERAVPLSDERNNAKMAYDTLLDHVPVVAANIHIMRTDIPAVESAAAYEKILHQYFDNTPTSFDLVLLGMGDDGHTLSLFPGMDVVHEETAWTKAFFLPAQDMFRITLTRPIVNRSASVAFLAAGDKKSSTLKSVLEGPYLPDQFPSQTIRPTQGTLHWFVDQAAASELTEA